MTLVCVLNPPRFFNSKRTITDLSGTTPTLDVESGEATPTPKTETTAIPKTETKADIISMSHLIQQHTSKTWETINEFGTIAVSFKARAIVVRQPHAVHDQLLQLLRDLREAKSLAPRPLAPAYGPVHSLPPAGNATRNPKILDEFSPGLVPDESQKRRRVPDAKLDEPAPPFDVPAPPKTKSVR